ncbi:MAG: hypothetical protein CVV50_04935, partial [Spirochaetae bacterium HGW-Spirochaetae-6]
IGHLPEYLKAYVSPVRIKKTVLKIATKDIFKKFIPGKRILSSTELKLCPTVKIVIIPGMKLIFC